MDTLLLLATADPAVDSARLEIALQEAGRQIVDSLPSGGASFRVARPWSRADGTAEEAELFGRVLEHGLSNGVRLGGFDLVLIVSLSSEAAPALSGIIAKSLEPLAGLTDPTMSALVVGREDIILEGSGDVHLIYCMRRLNSVSHDDFSRYWREQHSQIGKVTPGLAGYRQLHADVDRSSMLAAAAGVEIHDMDGVALEWFRDMDAFLVAVGSPPSHAQAAKSSEDNFNDISRATAIVVGAGG